MRPGTRGEYDKTPGLMVTSPGVLQFTHLARTRRSTEWGGHGPSGDADGSLEDTSMKRAISKVLRRKAMRVLKRLIVIESVESV